MKPLLKPLELAVPPEDRPRIPVVTVEEPAAVTVPSQGAPFGWAAARPDDEDLQGLSENIIADRLAWPQLILHAKSVDDLNRIEDAGDWASQLPANVLAHMDGILRRATSPTLVVSGAYEGCPYEWATQHKSRWRNWQIRVAKHADWSRERGWTHLRGPKFDEMVHETRSPLLHARFDLAVTAGRELLVQRFLEARTPDERARLRAILPDEVRFLVSPEAASEIDALDAPGFQDLMAALVDAAQELVWRAAHGGVAYDAQRLVERAAETSPRVAAEFQGAAAFKHAHALAKVGLVPHAVVAVAEPDELAIVLVSPPSDLSEDDRERYRFVQQEGWTKIQRRAQKAYGGHLWPEAGGGYQLEPWPKPD